MNLIKKIKFRLAKFQLSKEYFCCICNYRIGQFLPYKGGLNALSSFLKVLDIVGSDIDNFSCPRCWSHDRERHLFLYLEKMELLSKFHMSHILHFAPERWIAKIIADKKPSQYIKADLYPAAPDIVKVDMLNIQYPSEFFDFVIANHVLEHVNDELQALKELYRVLKPGGFAILQTPYSAKLLHTFCDAGIDDDESRVQAYGQEDHVRLYGRDIFERFESVGFISRVKTHSQILAGIDAKKYGLNQSEPFFLYEKVRSV
jgi:predicted SAM-dependent methyltransferase